MRLLEYSLPQLPVPLLPVFSPTTFLVLSSDPDIIIIEMSICVENKGVPVSASTIPSNSSLGVLPKADDMFLRI